MTSQKLNSPMWAPRAVVIVSVKRASVNTSRLSVMSKFEEANSDQRSSGTDSQLFSRSV